MYILGDSGLCRTAWLTYNHKAREEVFPFLISPEQSVSGFELEFYRLSGKEIPENGSYDDHSTEEDELFTGWCNERREKISGNEEFKAKNNLAGEFTPDNVITDRPFPDLAE